MSVGVSVDKAHVASLPLAGFASFKHSIKPDQPLTGISFDAPHAMHHFGKERRDNVPEAYGLKCITWVDYNTTIMNKPHQWTMLWRYSMVRRKGWKLMRFSPKHVANGCRNDQNSTVKGMDGVGKDCRSADCLADCSDYSFTRLGSFTLCYSRRYGLL